MRPAPIAPPLLPCRQCGSLFCGVWSCRFSGIPNHQAKIRIAAALSFMVVVIGMVGNFDLAHAIDQDTERKLRIARAVSTWDYIGHGRLPASLRDCRPETRIAISFDSNASRDWERFCYHGLPR